MRISHIHVCILCAFLLFLAQSRVDHFIRECTSSLKNAQHLPEDGRWPVVRFIRPFWETAGSVEHHNGQWPYLVRGPTRHDELPPAGSCGIFQSKWLQAKHIKASTVALLFIGRLFDGLQPTLFTTSRLNVCHSLIRNKGTSLAACRSAPKHGPAMVITGRHLL